MLHSNAWHTFVERTGLAGWQPCWKRASHSALQVCCRKICFVMFYVFSFPLGAYVGSLNLNASIHDLSILPYCRIKQL